MLGEVADSYTSLNRDEAVIGLQLVENHLQQGGLPVPVSTDEPDLLTSLDETTSILEEDLLTKCLADALYLKHVLSRIVSYCFLVLWREERGHERDISRP